MKKTYITPQTTVEVLECKMTILAASKFDINKDTQEITPTDEEYDDEFCAKGFGETIFD